MSRELRRLLIPPDRLRAGVRALVLEPPERHYLERVLRFRPGDRLAVVDGAGHLWTALLAEGGELRLEQSPSAPLRCEGALRPELELAMAVPKRETELVWRMASELGADRLQPLLAQRGVPGVSPPLERWRSVVREAIEQCERLWQPAVLEPAAAAGWLAQGPGTGEPSALGLLATTRRDGLPPLVKALREAVRLARASGSEPTRISLAIGPEGGWSEGEERLAEGAGWIPVSLGSPILRTGTAAVAGTAALCSWREFSSSSSPEPSP
jgi:16S rRNA (uracil1498-N3)-methyltransferase